MTATIASTDARCVSPAESEPPRPRAHAREALLKQLFYQPSLWDEVTFRQDWPTSPHHATETVYLRWASEWTEQAIFGTLEAVNQLPLGCLPAATTLIDEACRLLDAEALGRVIITRLPAGAKIDLHTDEGVYAEHFDRFHVVLATGAGDKFFVDGRPYRMKLDEIWYFNHRLPHEVHNDSGADRIHLIIDAVVPQYRALRRGA